jgi:O-antigen ligase
MLSVGYFTLIYHNPFALRMILSHQEGYTIFTNPNILTRAVILILPMLFVYSFYIKNKLIFLGIRFLVFLCLLLPIMTISRATTVSLSIIMFVLFWKNNNKILISVLIIILLIGVNIFVVNNRFVEVLEKGYAVGQRDQTAEISIASIKKNLLLGTGKRTAIENLEKHGGPTVGKDRRTLHEHNMYLYLMVESGLIGLLLFLTLIYFYIKYLIDHIKKAKNGMLKNLLFANLLGFLGFMLTTFTGGSINENIFWYQVGIAFGIIKLITISNYYQKTNFIPSTCPRVIG